MGQFQKGIRPDMDKNVIRRGEIVSDSGKLYSVIGVLGTVMYIWISKDHPVKCI